MSFQARWQTEALNETCTVALPTDPFTPSTADQYGMGAAFANAPSIVSLACMLIPPKSFVDRESGLIVSTPKQLLIADPNGKVSETSRITYQSKDYGIEQMQEDGELVLVTLKQ